MFFIAVAVVAIASAAALKSCKLAAKFIISAINKYLEVAACIGA